MKTIGYVSIADPFKDREAWSGTNYKLREAIESAGYRVVWIPYTPNRRLVWWLSHMLRLFNKHSIQYGVYPSYLKSCADSIDLSLVNQCDILFFPGMAMIMKYLQTDKPFIYFSDATFAQMVDFYWYGLDSLTLHYANKFEKWAIQNCALKISSSKWAAQSAEVDYQCDSQKNHIILFGANLDDIDITTFEEVKKKNEINLLFSGVEWERKGCDVAIDTVVELNKRGVNAVLNICGIKEIPQKYQPLPSCVNYYGFLNKNKAEEYRRYIDIIRKSDALLLPTKAECSAIVFCEAAAYSLPVFTYNTGGTGDYVVNGYNGYALKPGSTPKDFADAIQKNIDNLVDLRNNAQKHYQNCLNWQVWSKHFKELMDSYFKS